MSHRRPTRLAPALVALALAALLGGCGGQDQEVDESRILATVGDRIVTTDYYADRLGRLDQNQLPRDDAGQPMDMTTLAGKRAFLDVIINKEIMVAKALQLGYLDDPQVQAALEGLNASNALSVLWQDELGEPKQYFRQADLDHYYSRLGERRVCGYLIADHQADIEQAHADLQAGKPWDEVVATYHAGPIPEGQKLEMTVLWGQYRDSFERPVFAVGEGEVAGPLQTDYGWWLVKVNEVHQDQRPPLAQIRQDATENIIKRNYNLAREDLIASVARERGLMIDEEALLYVYEGMPEGERVIDPETNQPTAQSELLPLDVPLEALDLELVRYRLTAGPHVQTVEDFKEEFDGQNAFERPKKAELLGGLRAKLKAAAEREIMVDEARKRGYFADPRVQERSFKKVEEMLVDKLHREHVTFDENVGEDELRAFYEEYGHQYHKPERRSGHMVRCRDLATARQAREAVVQDGETWRDVNRKFGNDPELTRIFGRIVQMRADETGPVRETLFGLELDEVSEPFAVPGGFAVVQLGTIHAPEEPSFAELEDIIRQRIVNRRQDAALRDSLSRWREELGVAVNEERLAAQPSWQEAVRQVREAESLTN